MGQGRAWRGIGRLFGSSTCTASFIATSTDETAPAYALTNEHCIEWQANGVVGRPDYDGEVIFNYFVDTQASQISVPIKSVPYSTMPGVDVAIVELEATIDESWQPTQHPTVMIAQIDTTPPLLEPQVLVRDMGDAQQVDLVFEPPELSDFIFKFGPPDTTDCADEADYERFRRIPPIVENDDLPAKLCVSAFDHAGNPTEPLERLLSEDR